MRQPDSFHGFHRLFPSDDDPTNHGWPLVGGSESEDQRKDQFGIIMMGITLKDKTKVMPDANTDEEEEEIESEEGNGALLQPIRKQHSQDIGPQQPSGNFKIN